MSYFEKNCIIGAVDCGINKDTNETWYRVNYLDLETGKACQDYFENPQDGKILFDKKLPYGSKVVGLFTPNRKRLLVLVGTK